MPPTILLVDDEEHILKILKEPLVKRGYIVRTAGTGREAIEKSVQERPDLLVLDLLLPDMDGIEVIGRMRTYPELLDLSILLLTSGFSEHDKAAYIEAYTEANLVGKIRKPMPPYELVEAVQKALTNKGIPLPSR